MIILNDKFFRPWLVLTKLQCLHTRHTIPCYMQIIQCHTRQLITKVCKGSLACINTPPVPTPEASHLILNIFLKLGNASRGALHIFFLWTLNVFSWASPHANPYSYDIGEGTSNCAKVLVEPPIEATKATHLDDVLWSLTFFYILHLV